MLVNKAVFGGEGEMWGVEAKVSIKVQNKSVQICSDVSKACGEMREGTIKVPVSFVVAELGADAEESHLLIFLVIS